MIPKQTNILPFKIINEVPYHDTQLLLTTRSKRRIVLKNRPQNLPKGRNIEALPISRCHSPQILALNAELSPSPSSISPSAARNLKNLRNISYSPPPSALSRQTTLPLSPSNSHLRSIKIEESQYRPPEGERFHSTYLYGNVRECSGDLPSSQENSALIVLADKLLLQVTNTAKKNCSLYEYDPNIDHWRLVNTVDSPSLKKGFTSVGYKHKIVMYGGIRFKNNCEEEVRCSHKVYVFSLSNLKWNRFLGKGSVPTSRKNHACAVIHKYMVVYGGIDSKNRLLGDLCVFDIKGKEWFVPDLAILQDPGKCSHATLTAIFGSTSKNTGLFNLPSSENNGFYLFGGLLNEVPSNKLFILSVKSATLVWAEVFAKGNAPVPRYSHSACAVGFKLFIFGGRNDELYKNQIEMNQVHVFNAQNIEWETVYYSGVNLLPRWGHSIIAIDTKLYIFGGITYGKYLDNRLIAIETDWDKARDTYKKKRVIIK